MSPEQDEAEPAIEIEHSLTFKRREWLIQRIGWGVMLLVIIAAGLGLFGVGPISEASEQATGFGSVQYERFLRYTSPTTLTVEADREAFSDGAVQIWLSRAYVRAVQVEQVTPEPERVEASGDGHTYTFAVSDPGPAQIEFQVTPNRAGQHSAEIRVGEGPAMTLVQFVYP